MKLLIDMNLSPSWVSPLAEAGYTSVHWSSIGSPKATDREIMTYAAKHDYVVFTHDLDFGSLLNLMKMAKPSVIQIRIQNITPRSAISLILSGLQQFKVELDQGALVVIESSKNRIRMLPLN